MTKHDGDYELRTRGLEALFKPRDFVEWDILRTEMVVGVSDGRVGPFATPYIILRAYAGARGMDIGAECTEWVAGHRMGYLAHAIVMHGVSGRSPILVTTAVEELAELRTYVGS